MTVLVFLRQNQADPLTYAQGDANFQNLANAVNAVDPRGNSGSTTQRLAFTPTYVGEPWFDTTLGFIVNCSQISPPLWVTASGVSV